MTKPGITIRLVAVAGAALGGWVSASHWQAQPSLRSAVRLLFRPAAKRDDGAPIRSLTLNGITVSLADLRDAGSLRALLERLTEAAGTASPRDAAQFLATLIDQLASLSPADLRSLTIDLARDPGLLKQLDAATKALSSRLLSKDLELRLYMSLAAVVERDPDRMLLLADALPPSKLRDEFLGRTLAILSMHRPEAVLALLNGPDSPLKGQGLVLIGSSALQTLAARSLGSLMDAMKDIRDPQLQQHSRQMLLQRVNEQPDAVFAWLDGMAAEKRGNLAYAALSFADPETARLWLSSRSSSARGNPEAFLEACGNLAKTDPAAAADWLKKLPLQETGDTVDPRMVSSALGKFAIADLKNIIPGIQADTQAALLQAAFISNKRTPEELSQLAALTPDPALQQQMATYWARSRWGDPAEGIQQAESLPPGPLREASVASLSVKWSRSDPAAWLAWMRAASAADQTAGMAEVDPKVWSDPQNAAFLTSRPPSEQLPWLASIYHDNAPSAAAVIEQASLQGASAAALDAAAKSLAASWQDRDPATALAFAHSLPDPAMADSVLSGMAATSATVEARAAAVAAIQNPITRQQAERAAALRDAGIIPPPKKP